MKTTLLPLITLSATLSALVGGLACERVDVPVAHDLDAIAHTREQAALSGGGGTTGPTNGPPPVYCSYVQNFPRVSDGFSMYTDLISNPEQPAAATWVLPSNPSGITLVWVKWSLPYPACPAAVSETDLAQSGKVTVDGTAVGVEYFHAYSPGTNQFSSTIDMGNTPGNHTIKLSYSWPTRFGGVTSVTTSTHTVTFEHTNPFFWLQRTYASDRCIACHAFGGGSIAYNQAPIFHPFPVQANDSVGCQDCHQPFFDRYQPDAGHRWSTPSGMDWNTMTPQQRCTTTTGNLNTPAALHDHFDTDPRLQWAVESGQTHYGFAARPTAWPHNVADFFEVADGWIDSGASCANIDPPTRFNTNEL